MTAEKETILLIDDDAGLLQLTGIVLHKAGYKVAVAKSGAEGLARAEVVQPDLIILDVMMPDMSGYQVCEQVRANPHLARMPIIMLSAKGTEDDKVKGFRAGADDYVQKPVGNQELLARVHALLKRSKFTPTLAGRVILFVGAKGGVGTSTVAVNVTASLAQQGKNVLLAEIRPHGGAIHHMLNLTASQNLAPLLEEDPARMTAHDVSRRIIRHTSGFQLLLAPHDIAGYPLTGPHVKALLRHLPSKAEFVFLDTTLLAGEAIRPALEVAEQIILVTEPEQLSVASAQAALETFRAWGVYDRTGALIVTRAPSAMSLTRDKVEQRLGLRVIAAVPPAPEMFQEGARMGNLVVLAKPNALPSQAMVQIGDWIVAQTAVPV